MLGDSDGVQRSNNIEFVINQRTVDIIGVLDNGHGISIEVLDNLQTFLGFQNTDNSSSDSIQNTSSILGSLIGGLQSSDNGIQHIISDEGSSTLVPNEVALATLVLESGSNQSPHDRNAVANNGSNTSLFQPVPEYFCRPLTAP